MQVLIFGSTGMVGQGVLRECLLDSSVTKVTLVGRSTLGIQDAKLNEVTPAKNDLSDVENQLMGYDACFYCIGVTSSNVPESEYTRITHDLTLTAATTLARLNPQMVFVFISGAGADTSEKGMIMWARVKGKTENDLFKLPFKGVYALRPAIVQPMHGAKSRTRAYRIGYMIAAPVLPLLRKLFPKYVTTTEQIGKKAIQLAGLGGEGRVLENLEINS
jgi:uncharacterized protein YbjT (DUF2867 family)